MTVTMPTPLTNLFPFQIGEGFNLEEYRSQILFGSFDFKIPGILSHPEIPRFFACNVSDISNQELALYKIIANGIESLEALTIGVEYPDSLLLPYDINSNNILLEGLDDVKGIKNIDVLPELSKDFMPHGDTALLYTKHSSKLEVFLDRNRCDVTLYRPHSLAFIVGI